ncbi:hypothetical protein D3C76_1803150 [compost metagenome]
MTAVFDVEINRVVYRDGVFVKFLLHILSEGFLGKPFFNSGFFKNCSVIFTYFRFVY